MKTIDYHVVFYASEISDTPISLCRYVHDCSFFGISDRDELLSEVEFVARRFFGNDYVTRTIYARVYNYKKYFSKGWPARRRASCVLEFSSLLPNNR